MIYRLAVYSSLWVCLSIMATGCASFPNHQVSEITVLPPLLKQMAKKDISYTFTVEGSGRVISLNECNPSPIKFRFENMLESSGYFSTVNRQENPDIKINLRLLKPDPNVMPLWTLLSVISLTLIPSSHTENTGLIATIHWKNRTREYYIKDSMDTVMWLPMIAVAPFHNPENETWRLYENLYKTILFKMYQDGLFMTDEQPGT